MKLNALNRLGFIGQHTKLGDVIAKLVNRDADVLEAIKEVASTDSNFSSCTDLSDFIGAVQKRTNSIAKSINKVQDVFGTITLYKDANGNIIGGKATYKISNNENKGYEIKVVDAPQ